jgi:hypothetical protein
MTYSAEIVLVAPPGIASDNGMPVLRLPGRYSTVERAGAAASHYIERQGIRIGSAYFRILNKSGIEVGL